MALFDGSAAIDGAIDCRDVNGDPVDRDQRGVPRPQGGQCDIGAYEKSAMSFTGFASPIANLPFVNAAREGQSVPVRFSLGGDFGLGITDPLTIDGSGQVTITPQPAAAIPSPSPWPSP